MWKATLALRVGCSDAVWIVVSAARSELEEALPQPQL
jgi:hypothetical protein